MKNLVKIILIAAFITGASLSFGQSKALKKGVKKITKGEYDLAISQFQKYTDSRELGGEANFYLGECYRLSNRVHRLKIITRRLSSVATARKRFIFIMPSRSK
jgi:hypothetical protein